VRAKGETERGGGKVGDAGWERSVTAGAGSIVDGGGDC